MRMKQLFRLVACATLGLFASSAMAGLLGTWTAAELSAGTEKNGLTPAIGTNTYDETNGYITIDAAPVLLTGTTTWDSTSVGVTVVLTVSNLLVANSESGQTLVSYNLGGTADRLGLGLSTDGNLYGMWNGSLRTDTTSALNSAAIRAFPTDGGTYQIAFFYNSSGCTAQVCGADGDVSTLSSPLRLTDTGLKASNATVGTSIALGALSTSSLPATGLQIHSVSVYNSVDDDPLGLDATYGKHPGTIYTLDNTSSGTTFHSGTVTAFSTGATSSGTTFWHKFASTTSGYSSTGSTLRFASGIGSASAQDAQFNPISFGGLIVEEGATNWSFSSAGGTSARSTEIGVSDATTYFTVNEDFSISRTSSNNQTLTVYGTVNIDIASGKTLSLNASNSDGITMDTGAALVLTGAGTLTFNNVSFANATLDVSALTLGTTSSDAAPLNGTVTIDDTTTLKLPATASSEGTTYYIASAATADSFTTRNLYIGDTQTSATVTVAEDGSVSYAVIDTSNAKTLVWPSTATSGNWSDADAWTNQETSETATFADGDTIIFDSGADTTTTVTLASTVLPTSIAINSGTVIFEGGNYLGDVPVAIASGATLKITDNATALSLAFAGTGTVEIATGANSISTTQLPASCFSGFTGTLLISSGRYAAESTPIADTVAISITDGGQLYVTGGTWANAITAAGSGWTASSDAAKDSPLRIDGATLSNVTLDSTTSVPVMVYGSSTGYISSLTAAGGFTKVGAGTLRFTTATAGAGVSGTVTVSAGTVDWGNGSGATAGTSYKLGDTIDVASGATLNIRLWATTQRNTSTTNKAIIASAITLNDSAITFTDGSYMFSGAFTVNGTCTFTDPYSKGYVFSEFNGSGTLTFSRGTGDSNSMDYFTFNGGNFSGIMNQVADTADNTRRIRFASSFPSATINLTTEDCYVEIAGDIELGSINDTSSCTTGGIFGDGEAARTLTLNNGATYYNVIKDTAAATGAETTTPLSVVFAGDTTLAGANTLTGDVTVSSGATLTLDGTLPAVTVSDGAAITGTGTVTGTLTAVDGSTLNLSSATTSACLTAGTLTAAEGATVTVTLPTTLPTEKTTLLATTNDPTTTFLATLSPSTTLTTTYLDVTDTGIVYTIPTVPSTLIPESTDVPAADVTAATTVLQTLAAEAGVAEITSITGTTMTEATSGATEITDIAQLVGALTCFDNVATVDETGAATVTYNFGISKMVPVVSTSDGSISITVTVSVSTTEGTSATMVNNATVTLIGDDTETIATAYADGTDSVTFTGVSVDSLTGKTISVKITSPVTE